MSKLMRVQEAMFSGESQGRRPVHEAFRPATSDRLTDPARSLQYQAGMGFG
jgi:hypothetical protein